MFGTLPVTKDGGGDAMVDVGRRHSWHCAASSWRRGLAARGCLNACSEHRLAGDLARSQGVGHFGEIRPAALRADDGV